ncbi:Type I restriction modification DNA specificity domain-containing protein [Spirosomataceae bacterium TFI 002]|nr:Type I restriction modification DNA specificity domain-containing protein [Spirosomataceae bacterium TFI 002]
MNKKLLNYQKLHTFASPKKKTKLTRSISNIATIKSGVYAKTATEGDCLYLQGKDFSESGELDTSLAPSVRVADANPKHFLNHNDILLLARGDNNAAFLFTNTEYPALASPTFLVLTVNEFDIQPEFLLWYLNSYLGQKRLKRESKGSSIQSITIKTLANIEIDIPPMNIQDQIVAIANLSTRRTKLSTELNHLKRKEVELLLFETAKKQ